MKNQYYFEFNDSEMCYDADYFQDRMLEEGKTEMEVFEGVPERIPGVFWCGVECFCGDDSANTCGLQCKQYDPRNGKNGRCKHHNIWLRTHGDKITLKLKQ